MRNPAKSHFIRRGFTLVEILLVVVLLGLLAALVIPQFSNATDIARSSALRQELKIFRTQVQMYRSQHNGVSPGYPGGNPSATPNAAAFEAQMLGHTDIYGAVSPVRTEAHRYGPYLPAIPINPFNNRRDVRVLADDATFPADPVGTEAWLFHPGTGRLVANDATVDHEGVRLFEY